MKLKSLYLILMLTIGTALMAQEKYEQAIVQQVNKTLSISMEGKEDEIIKADDKSQSDRALLLNQMAVMRTEGWEVWNSALSPNGFVYFLKRKLK